MGRIFGVGCFKPANAFVHLAERIKFKNPVHYLDKAFVNKLRVPTDTFVKTNMPAKKIYKPNK